MFKRLEKRRSFLLVIAIISVIFCGTVGALKYTSAQALAKQQGEAKAELEKMEQKIIAVRAKKIAEQKARQDAERKASSDGALESQLAGNVVTPKGCAISGNQLNHGDPNRIEVLINKKHCFNPINFAPSDLVSFQDYLVSAKIVSSLQALFNAAASAGVPLGLTSAYRSYYDQVATYNNWVKVNGSYQAADTVSARPGYSEHQTGFAVDLSTSTGCSLDCFTKTAQYQWLKEHAFAFGFVERYPVGMESITGYSPEAWHWRYVGPAVATALKSSKHKTLEQLWGITGGGY